MPRRIGTTQTPRWATLGRLLLGLALLLVVGFNYAIVDSNPFRNQSESTCRHSPPTIACIVPIFPSSTTTTMLPERLNAIVDTWGKHCSSMRFFIVPAQFDPTASDKTWKLPDDKLHRHAGFAVPITVLSDVTRKSTNNKKPCLRTVEGVPTPCVHTWEYTWRMWLFVAQHMLDQADFFVKVDPDAIIFPNNIKKFIRSNAWSRGDAHYFGHELFQKEGEQKSNFAANAMYGLSHRALKIFGEILQGNQHFSEELHLEQLQDYTVFACYDRPGGGEDVMVARCLRSVGISVEDTRDANDRTSTVILDGNEWSAFPEWYTRGKSLLRSQREWEKHFSAYPLALYSARLENVNVRIDLFRYLTRTKDSLRESVFTVEYLDAVKTNVKFCI